MKFWLSSLTLINFSRILRTTLELQLIEAIVFKNNPSHIILAFSLSFSLVYSNLAGSYSLDDDK